MARYVPVQPAEHDLHCTFTRPQVRGENAARGSDPNCARCRALLAALDRAAAGRRQ